MNNERMDTKNKLMVALVGVTLLALFLAGHGNKYDTKAYSSGNPSTQSQG